MATIVSELSLIYRTPPGKRPRPNREKHVQLATHKNYHMLTYFYCIKSMYPTKISYKLLLLFQVVIAMQSRKYWTEFRKPDRRYIT